MFFNIHNHTDQGSNLRLRDSTNRVQELIDYSHSLGYMGLCITDHESIAAHLDALKYFETKKDDEEWENFKLGLGNEIYLCSDDSVSNGVYPHFILVALNATGHKGIRELSTHSWGYNSFMKVMYQVPTYYRDLVSMVNQYQGTVIGSTACLGGSVPKTILKYKNKDYDNPNKLQKACIDWIEYMDKLFGHGYFFLELQPSETEEQIIVNKELVQLSEITGVPYIITTDSHYLKASDRNIHRAFLNAQDGDREVDDFYASTYVMSEQEIHGYMDKYLGADAVNQGLENTKLIYDMIEPYTLTKDLHIPYLPLNHQEPDIILYNKYLDKIPLLKHFKESEIDSDRHLVREIVKYIDTDPAYQTEVGYDKINEALSYIKLSSMKMNVPWSAYLLQVADYVKIAWDSGTLVGCGRGSGVGFCLLHILGITQINPILENTKTYPWRFMNPERSSVLDIDIDIMSCKRDEVIRALKDEYGEDRVAKVMTLSTEKSKSAILTAGRGLGLDNVLTSYIASLIVYDRGTSRTLKQMYYGDEDHKPVPDFVREMKEHPDLWETAQRIEGLVCGVSSHTGGVIIVDEPFTESTALMKTKSGDIITQFDLHGCEDVSLIKIDLLCIDALDKIYETLILLLKDKKIEWQGSLKATYEKYLGVYTLERDAEDMWELLWNHKVISFFQMEKESGKQALALAKPHSVDDLAVINSVIRLMPQTANAERPLEKFARFKNDISLWYDEMKSYGLKKKEQKLLEPILKGSYGICETQEKFMQLVQIPECGGFSLQFADKLRKSIAKKNPKEYDALTKQFFKVTKEQGCSKKLCNYVWNNLIATSRGYGFCSAHCLSYSMIGLQELNLCYKYDPIYWQTANLIVDSGSLDASTNDATNYGKMAVAIATIQGEGVRFYPPTVEQADFGFQPDEEHNDIIFGLKAINGINTDVARSIVKKRPYRNIEDFCEKLVETKIISPSQMIKLIKAGCFTELHSKNKTETMEWYLNQYLFTPCNKLGMAQLGRMKDFNLIPSQFNDIIQIIDFKKQVTQNCKVYHLYIDSDKKLPKKGYHDRWLSLDKNTQLFFEEFCTKESVVGVNGIYYVVSEKKLLKEIDKKVDVLKEWMSLSETVNQYNTALFQALWEEKVGTKLDAWSMEAACYYDACHELTNVDTEKYGIVNYFDLPEDPEPYTYYTRKVNGVYKTLPKFKISRIAGTILQADNNHYTVSLLTLNGVVTVKFNKGQYAFYKKRISKKLDINSDKKTVIEDSWLKRGNLLTIQGMRQNDMFFPKVYQDTIYSHTVNLIKEIFPDGSLVLQYERANVS